MKKILLLLFLISQLVLAQEKETITQKSSDFIGLKNKTFLLQEPHSKWYFESYDTYTTHKKTIKKIKSRIQDFQIKVFMSVWCHDSHREIPRLFKILEHSNFNFNNLELIALDRSKKTPDNLQKGFNIKRTPTIIILKDGKEVSRFVEQPVKNLEKDLLRILSGKNYQHAYYKQWHSN